MSQSERSHAMAKTSIEVLFEREEAISQFLADCNEVEDPRSKSGRSYNLAEIFLLVLCAQVCGFETLREYQAYGEMKLEVLRHFLPYKKGVPSKHTLSRVLSLFKPMYLEQLLLLWIQRVVEDNVRQIAIDGKIHRGIVKEDEARLHLVNAYPIVWIKDSY